MTDHDELLREAYGFYTEDNAAADLILRLQFALRAALATSTTEHDDE
jgi:hypothetical protein